MWNEDIPPAFRYKSFQFVIPFLIRFPHTVPVDGIMALYFFQWIAAPYSRWSLSTVPYANLDEFIRSYEPIGREFSKGGDPYFPPESNFVELWVQAIDTLGQTSIVAYYTPALQKIDKILSGYEVGFPEERIHLKDMPPYSRITSKAVDFMKTTINFDMSSIKTIINDHRRRVMDVEQPSFRRIQNIQTEYKKPLGLIK